MSDRSFEHWRRHFRPPERTDAGVILGEHLFEQLVYASEKLVEVVKEVAGTDSDALRATFQQTFPVANEIYRERDHDDV